jgi:hypothetical protein
MYRRVPIVPAGRPHYLYMIHKHTSSMIAHVHIEFDVDSTSLHHGSMAANDRG